MPHEDQDKELDPKRIRFGMSRKEREELEREEKTKRKLPKSFKPLNH